MASLVLALLAFQEVVLRIEPQDLIFRPGEPMWMRFVVENTLDQEVEFDEPADYHEGLEVRDPEDRIVRAPGKQREPKCRRRLEGRGFFGRTLDVTFPVPEDGDGTYTFRWRFQTLASSEVRMLILRDYLARIDTNFGLVTIEFHPEVAPIHVLHFVNLVRKGFYAEAKFYRIIPGFMMQGGQPAKAETVPAIAAEFSDRKHTFGTVSMARQESTNSATSEFFICLGTASHLDHAYTVFGSVADGQEVVRNIERVKTDHNPCRECKQTLPEKATQHCGTHHADRPLSDVVIRNITLLVRKK